MRHEVDRYEQGDVIVRIVLDEDPLDPRKEHSNAWHFWCRHRRYNLGDGEPTDLLIKTDEDEGIARLKPGVMARRLYLLDHSDLAISLGPFACDPQGWDSGPVGWALISREKILEEWGQGKKRVTRKMRDLALECLQAEVKEYDQYLRGEVYGILVEDWTGHEIDGCWGYSGYDYAKQEAKRQLEYWAEHYKIEGLA